MDLEDQSSQPNSQPVTSMKLVLLLAGLPFLVKWASLMLGASGYFWQSAYKLPQLAGPVLWRHRREGYRGLASWWPVDQPLPSLATWGLGVGIATMLTGTAIVAVTSLAPQMGIEPDVLRAGLDKKFAMTPWRAAAVVMYLFTVNAGLEELHFRAWLDGQLSASLGDLSGIGGSAIAFAAMHVFIFSGLDGVSFSVLLLLFLALWIAGVSWSLLARRPGGIHAAWLSHGLTDAGLLTWGLFWLGYFTS